MPDSGALASGDPEARAARSASLRIPDFFIVGHPKSGTTALYEMLCSHPQIYLPRSKEPWFFADELHERTPPRPEGTPRTLEQYCAWFQEAGAEQMVGEASALYLWSHTAARAIAAVAPDARIIAILREPVSFLHSLHLQYMQTYVEIEPDFERALALEEERRQGRHVPRHTYWPRAILYSEYIRYAEQLRRYWDAFGRDRVLVLVYEEFRADNEPTVRSVLRFLGVDEKLAIEPRSANPTVRVRSARAHEALHALSVGRGRPSLAVKTAIKALTPRGPRRAAVRAVKGRLVFAEPRPPDAELTSKLRRRFKPEVEAVSECLGRDLVGFWGYDRLG